MTGDTRLSPREVTVLALIGEGLTNKEIGRRLRISQSHLKNLLSGTETRADGIYAKLGVDNRVQAALWWHRNKGTL